MAGLLTPRRLRLVVLMGLGALMLPLLLTPTPAGADQADSAVFRVASASIGAGEDTTCVVQDDSRVRCWGPNDRGELGVPLSTPIGTTTTPGQHPALELGGRVRAVSMGNSYGCALLESGQVRCWGYNRWGQLGQGNIGNYSSMHAQQVPLVPLGPGRTARAIAAGHSTTCVILDTGQVRCWGYNGSGNLGQGTVAEISDTRTPDQIPVVNLGPGRTARALAVGSQHACALLDDGSVRCWGGNADWQLGQGNTTTYSDRTPDGIPAVYLGRPAQAISAGDDHTCAILDNGEVRCWGKNKEAQLGRGSVAPNTQLPGNGDPVDLGPGRQALVIASSAGNSSCVTTNDSQVMCWGQIAPASRSLTPNARAPYHFPLPALALAPNKASLCALLTSGQVYCTGKNDVGQLGQGNTKDSAEVLVPVGARVRTRAATGLAQRVQPVRDRKRPYVFTFTGRVVGVFAADDVTCAGVVSVVIRKRKKIVGQGRVALQPDNGGCAYGLRVITHRKKRGKLVATTTYSGNLNLTPSAAVARLRAG